MPNVSTMTDVTLLKKMFSAGNVLLHYLAEEAAKEQEEYGQINPVLKAKMKFVAKAVTEVKTRLSFLGV